MRGRIHHIAHRRDIFVVKRRQIGKPHHAARLFGRAIHLYVDLHSSSLRLSAARRGCIASAMYAQDEAVIATPIGAVRITGNDRAITRLAIDHAGTPSAGRAEAVRAAARSEEHTSELQSIMSNSYA